MQRILFVFILFMIPRVVFADVRLAILEFRGVGINNNLLQLLTDEVRTGVLHANNGQKVRGENLIIMTKENMMQVLKDQGLSAKDCTGECEVEIAKNIGADYVISGTVTQIDTLFVLVLKLHETADSNLLGSQSLKTESKKELITESNIIGGKVFQEALQRQTNKTTREQDPPPTKGKPTQNSGYEVVLIPSGSFMMGCTSEDSGCQDDQKPLHKVTLTRDFYMMKHEVTQGLYKTIRKKRPSVFKKCGETCPVESVSWYDAVRFANSLSKKEGLEECYTIGWGGKPNVVWSNKSCLGWRLPTEAEWEYAARGNQDFIYSGSNNPDQVAWYGDSYDGPQKGNSNDTTHQVCTKKANAFGLCDMSGNVAEWVWDAWVKDAYKRHKDVDPIFDLANPAVDGSFTTDMYVEGNARHYRGGKFRGFNIKVYERGQNIAGYYGRFVGFRLVRTSP